MVETEKPLFTGDIDKFREKMKQIGFLVEFDKPRSLERISSIDFDPLDILGDSTESLLGNLSMESMTRIQSYLLEVDGGYVSDAKIAEKRSSKGKVKRRIIVSKPNRYGPLKTTPYVDEEDREDYLVLQGSLTIIPYRLVSIKKD